MAYQRWMLLTGFLQVFRKHKHNTDKYENTPHNWFQDILFYIPERYQPHNDVDRRILPTMPTSSPPAPAPVSSSPAPHAHDCPTGPTLTDNMDLTNWVTPSTTTPRTQQPTSTAPREPDFILRRYGPQGGGRRPAFPPHSPDRDARAPRPAPPVTAPSPRRAPALPEIPPRSPGRVARTPRSAPPVTASSPGRAPTLPKRARLEE